MELQFDATNVNPTMSFDVLPPNWYAATIEDVDEKTTKAGDLAANFKFKIDETVHPEIGGRVLFSLLNLNHPNDKVREIAERELSAICHAVGVLHLKNTDALLCRKLAIKVTVKPAEGQYEARNEVKGYDSFDARFGNGANAVKATAGQPAQSSRRAETAASEPAAAGAAPGWRRNK